MDSPTVVIAFNLGCAARRDDPDNVATGTLAVAYQQKICFRTHAEHEEAIFLRSMLFIEKLHSKVVKEDGLSLLEGDLVLLEVGRRLGAIPLKSNHLYIV